MSNNFGNNNGSNYGGNGSNSPFGGSGQGDETSVFGATEAGNPHPQQVFPDSQQQQPPFGQQMPLGQQDYNQPVLNSYEPPQKKKGSTVVIAVLSALLALTVIGLLIFAFLFTAASKRAQNTPVTETLTTTAVTTATATPSRIIPPLDGLPTEIPTEIPTELPPELQQQLDDLENQISDDPGELQDLLDSLVSDLGSLSG